jgi:prepilin-type N-terminal cleavage/methylation domain-containing protein
MMIQPMQKKCHSSGFTLLEVLLSVAIIGIISGIGIPVFQSFQVSNDMGVTTSTVIQTLRRAQLLAQANDRDSQWGIKAQSGSITLFKGDSYIARDTSADEVYTTPASLQYSGLTEVVYSKLFGIPTPTGTLTITSANNETSQIVVNAKGMVQ